MNFPLKQSLTTMNGMPSNCYYKPHFKDLVTLYKDVFFSI